MILYQSPELSSWSYTKHLEDTRSLPQWAPTVKRCECDSHYLFCWGHEKQCDYYEDSK